MAFDFTPERSVLNFGPKHHARWRSRRFVLWPAWAYRVVAPRVRQRQLNVLQRAVMGLCKAGLGRVESIADQISVHVDLATFIMTELADAGYVDSHGLLTAAGESVLERDTFQEEEMVAGYVFQDPWQGDLWPRFVESLEYVEVEYGENGFPSLVLGTSGKPRREGAFTVLPRTGLSPVAPRAQEIVQAVAQHRRGLRSSDPGLDDEERLGAFVASGVQVKRVSFVDDEPLPVLLMTYLYVPEAEEGPADWHVCDPFGLGQSVRLRRRVETLMAVDRGLFEVVKGLVGEAPLGSFEDRQTWLELIQRNAEVQVFGLLTVDFAEHGAFQQVLEMESAHQEMRLLGCNCPQRKVNEVLRAGVKVLEAVFGVIADAYPLGDVWIRVYERRIDRRTGKAKGLMEQRDPSVYAATYEGAFSSLGFAKPFPPALLSTKPSQVKSVAQFGDSWRLRPLVTATALRAQEDSLHPLARAAAQCPTLLSEIDSIATAGSAAGHASSGAVEVASAEQHVARVYRVVSTLLGLNGSGLTSLSDSPAGGIDG